MYSIGTVIYGWYLGNIDECNDNGDEIFDEDNPGYFSLYSGEDADPRAFGIKLTSLDCIDVTKIEIEKWQPTVEQKLKLNDLLSNLNKEQKSCLSGEPEVFILWSTS